MIYLFASIFSSALIYVTFKASSKYKVNLLPVITINYLVATILGWGGLNKFQVYLPPGFTAWYPFAAILGILFIVMFFMIGISTRKAGLTITTLANKTSLVIPVFFSIAFFNENITIPKIAGLIIALLAIVLIIYKKSGQTNSQWPLLLPILIFAGSGTIDSMVKYVQEIKVTDAEIPVFSTAVFAVAMALGIVALLFRQDDIRQLRSHSTWITGTVLGVANFGSLFFLIKALDSGVMQSSVVFALNNLSVVALTTLTGLLVFNEKLSLINFAGIILACFSIYLLS